METHPLVLLVEPDPLLRELIHGELKDQGCIVFDAANERAALSFAAVYPGAIDLAVTDLPQAHQQDRAFASALRLLPTGTATKVIDMSTTTESTLGTPSDISRSNQLKPFDRESLLQAIRTALPSSNSMNAQAEHGDQAVFWGAFRTNGSNVSLSVL
jgi:CheY-like chemotaxis protein